MRLFWRGSRSCPCCRRSASPDRSRDRIAGARINPPNRPGNSARSRGDRANRSGHGSGTGREPAWIEAAERAQQEGERDRARERNQQQRPDRNAPSRPSKAPAADEQEKCATPCGRFRNRVKAEVFPQPGSLVRSTVSGEPATAQVGVRPRRSRSPRSSCASVATSAVSVVRDAGTHCCCLPLWLRLSLVASEAGAFEAARLPRQALNIKLMLSHYAGPFVCCALAARLPPARGRAEGASLSPVTSGPAPNACSSALTRLIL